MTVSEELRKVAADMESQAEALRQDWVKVLLSAGHRARINTLSEMAVKCRIDAARLEKKR